MTRYVWISVCVLISAAMAWLLVPNDRVATQPLGEKSHVAPASAVHASTP